MTRMTIDTKITCRNNVYLAMLRTHGHYVVKEKDTETEVVTKTETEIETETETYVCSNFNGLRSERKRMTQRWLGNVYAVWHCRTARGCGGRFVVIVL
jgi:hypothetical protein